MVIFSFFLFIERIIFMFSNKLEAKEDMPQIFYYYFSGVGGGIYFFVLFCISIIGYRINYLIMLLVMCIIYFLSLSRSKYCYEKEKELIISRDNKSERINKLRNYIKFINIVRWIDCLGFALLLMVAI